MEYSVVIVAAGRGQRMNLGYNKVYHSLGNITILEQTISVFRNDCACKQIIVVTNPDDYYKHCSKSYCNLVLVQGGKERQDSVYNGLNAVISPYVLIHDGARPFLKIDELEKLKQATVEYRAACLMVPCKDTIKVVKDGFVECTLERNVLQAAQTPQGFETNLFYECIQKARKEHFYATDDCTLVEKYCDVRVKAILGDYTNIKITTQDDLKNRK